MRFAALPVCAVATLQHHLQPEAHRWQANRLVVNSIKSFGYSDKEAEVMKECMMWAQV